MEYQELSKNGLYYAYLRKSRADQEAEARGEGETLTRHKKILEELSASLGIKITKFYREIVSGETIKDRPVIQELLHDISAGACNGVLVVEVERLARGNTSDQGKIAEYFQLSHTLIITPMKIYDPNDDYDEEYFEFGLFMSRREYKTINRRLQRGRISSVKEGKWVASTAPYGYERVRLKNEKGYTLKIIPEQAKIVQLIYDLYTHGEEQPDGSFHRLGHYRICKKLDLMGIRPVISPKWSPSSIKDILRNPTYIGKVAFGKEQEKKVIVNGQTKKVRVKNSNYQLYEGIHPAIIEEAQFQQVQALIKAQRLPPVVSNKELKNPLSGLIYCSKCAAHMTRAASNTKDGYPVLICPTRGCDTVSSPLYLVEEKVIEGILNWFGNYRLEWTEETFLPHQIQGKENALKSYHAELLTLAEQKSRACGFLEQAVYTPEVFTSRLQVIDQKRKDIQIEIKRLEALLKNDPKKEYGSNTFIPRINNILEIYSSCEDAAVRNQLLKDVISRIEYEKTEPNKKFQRDHANFRLKIYPKLPEKQV